jgi:hypothetical protein
MGLLVKVLAMLRMEGMEELAVLKEKKERGLLSLLVLLDSVLVLKRTQNRYFFGEMILLRSRSFFLVSVL